MTSPRAAAPRGPLTTRRSALAGGAAAGLGLAAATVSGCRATGPTGRPADATATTETTSDVGGDDETLVAAALVELTRLAALVASVRRSTPGLGEPLRPLLRLHRAHAAALGAPLTGALVGGADVVSGVDGRPEKVLRRVRTQEQRLQRRLVRWSIEADSGALARLLASMSAGLAQHLAVLPDQVTADEVPAAGEAGDDS